MGNKDFTEESLDVSAMKWHRSIGNQTNLPRKISMNRKKKRNILDMLMHTPFIAENVKTHKNVMLSTYLMLFAQDTSPNWIFLNIGELAKKLFTIWTSICNDKN